MKRTATGWTRGLLALMLLLPVTRVQAQTQTPAPNLYTWLRNNPNPIGGGPTNNFVWYWGCAAGLPGACQYVAVGPLRSPWTVFSNYYNLGWLYTPTGVSYGLYDMWVWQSPSEYCSGAESTIHVPKSCLPYLSKMTWSTRVEWYEGGQMYTSWPTFRYVSGATVTPEPATLALLGSGLIGLSGVASWRRRVRRS